MNEDTTIAPKGRELVKKWQDAEEDLRRADERLVRARVTEDETRKALAKWLLPSDVKPGEKIGVWERDKHGNEIFFEAMILPDGSHSVIEAVQGVEDV
jgi:hypothetical protein